MKLNKQPRELGEYYEEDAPTWFYPFIVISVVIGLLILFIEYSGVADQIINSIACK